jgi:DNA-binding NarL/FixJ family response regulator
MEDSQTRSCEPNGIPNESCAEQNTGFGAPNVQGFTERQNQIIRLVALGYDNRQIAESLSLAQQTVKNHLHTIFEKAGVSKRSDLVVLAHIPAPKRLVNGNLPRQPGLQ